jgi:phosphatidylinositol alpha-mannosyltransferase
VRICLVTPYDLADSGGVKRHVDHLADRLRASGDEVVVIGPHSGGPLPPGVKGLHGVVEVRANGSNARAGVLVSPLEVWRLMRERYDVVHVMEPVVPSLGWYAAWFSRAAARIATFHAFNEHECAVSRLFRRGLGAAQCALFDRAIAVSAAAARFAEVTWRRPLALIPNGVDTATFRPGERIPFGPLKLLFVGHWHNPRKGLGVLLEAYRILCARGSELSLEVVGDGDESSQLPGVRYRPAISDERALAERFRAADLFIAPSLGSESFGIVLLEAMASGLPVICSDIEGYRSAIAKDGARLVPPGDPEALAETIAAVGRARKERYRMGEINRRAALSFDWSAIASHVRQEYLAALQ